MDSLGLFMSLNVNAVLQMAKIYSIPESQSILEIQKLSVQQQKGTVDCGLFSVAYAVEMCLGRNPQCASFAQEKMRNHLYACLTNKLFTPFPKLSTLTNECLPRPVPVLHKVKIFCKCRMPEEYDDLMIACDICKRWFHARCVNVDGEALPDLWECCDCIQEL